MPSFSGVTEKKLKDYFLISNISAGNGTPCRGQHVARELQVDQPDVIHLNPKDSDKQLCVRQRVTIFIFICVTQYIALCLMFVCPCIVSIIRN